MRLEIFKQQLFETQNRFIHLFVNRKIVLSEEFIFLGNSYSGYWFPKNYLRSEGTIWGVGLGRDSSFELELVNLGYKFIGFEPEPACYEISVEQFRNTNAVIENFGLWDKSGMYKYTGENISIVNIFKRQDFSDDYLEIRSLWKVAQDKELQNMPQPRILKMNIEGAEREILLRFIEEPIMFDVLIFQAEFLFHKSFFDFLGKIKAATELRLILKKLKEENWELIGFTRHQITLRKKLNT